MSRRLNLVLSCLGLLLVASQAQALTVPFNETFSVDASNWRNSTSTAVTYNNGSLGGGFNGVGDGFITQLHTYSGDGPSTILRGQDAFDSSGDAFVGNWNTGGVKQFSFFIRQDSGVPLTIGARFATNVNNPGINQVSSTPLQSGVWTRYIFDVRSTNPAWTIEGPPSALNAVLNSVGNIQILADRGANLVGSTTTFSLDQVMISSVPEPSSLVLAGFGLIGGLVVARRRRKTA